MDPLLFALSARGHYKLVILDFSQVDLHASVRARLVSSRVFAPPSPTHISIGVHLDRSTTSLLHDLLPTWIQRREKVLPFVSLEDVMVLGTVYVV